MFKQTYETANFILKTSNIDNHKKPQEYSGTTIDGTDLSSRITSQIKQQTELFKLYAENNMIYENLAIYLLLELLHQRCNPPEQDKKHNSMAEEYSKKMLTHSIVKKELSFLKEEKTDLTRGFPEAFLSLCDNDKNKMKNFIDNVINNLPEPLNQESQKENILYTVMYSTETNE